MNEPTLNPNLPPHCDVLIIGAGPAGSAAAQLLARAGRDVLLVDRQTFPREKVCGDGLIPDSHRALARLGVLEAVMARAHQAGQLGIVGSRGGRVDVPARLAVLPRLELDEILRAAAEAAGARFAAPWRFVEPLRDGARIAGARLQQGDAVHDLRADWTLLATGAGIAPLQAMGVCLRTSPSAVALRGHVRHEALHATWPSLDVVLHRRLRGGYGWVFPAPNGCFNIGVGGAGRETGNLRALFADFCDVYPPAGQLMREGQPQGPLKGAPLRWSLEGADAALPGLLVAGDAVGSTYALTGEGIGKAMETGMLAAEALLAGGDDAAVAGRYRAALTALKPRFELYAQAQQMTHWPLLLDFIIWRGRKSAGVRRRMAGVLDETSAPRHLLSLHAWRRLLWPGA